MKKANKTLLMSVLTIVMCVSLIAGATFALFSSDSKVNVALTSGNVDVVASVNTETLTGYSTRWDADAMDYISIDRPDGVFYAGGTYSYAEGSLALNGIAPGDAVEFDLTIENRSTLNIQYRVQLTVPTAIDSKGTPQGTMVKQLVVSFDDAEPAVIGEQSVIAQRWSDEIPAGQPITIHPHVRVELPYTLGNEYQGQSCLLHVGVYAVQLGTHTADDYGEYNAYTANDLVDIFGYLMRGEKTFEGETIALMNDINLSPDSDGGASTLSIALADSAQSQREWWTRSGLDGRFYPFKGTFNGNGFTISGFRTPKGVSGDLYNTASGDGHGYGLFRYTRNAVIENVIIENVALTLDTDYLGGNSRAECCGYAGIVAGQAENTTFRNITIANSTVKSITEYDKKTQMFNGTGYRLSRTVEEAAAGLYEGYPIVSYDFVGALVGQIKGDTTIENVNITLNESSTELTGVKLFGNTPNFGPDQAQHEVAYNVVYSGESTLNCVSESGLVETLNFDQSNNGSNTEVSAPAPSVDINSADALESLVQSVADGRSFEGISVNLTADIVLGDENLTAEGFKGTINGNGKNIYGVSLAQPGILGGAAVHNAQLQFTTEDLAVTVADPDVAVSAIAAQYVNTTVTVAAADASYTLVYGQVAGTPTQVTFAGYTFEGEQSVAQNISYVFNGVTFNGSLASEQAAMLSITDSTFGAAAAIALASATPVLQVTLAQGSVVTGNTFNGDVVLGADQGATVCIQNNTISGALAVSGTVVLAGNTVNATQFVTAQSGAQVIITSDNKLGESAISYDAIGGEDYAFVGWNVALDGEGKIVSGTFALGSADVSAVTALAAEDAEIYFYDGATGLIKNGDGAFVIDSVQMFNAFTEYVNGLAQDTFEADVVLAADIDYSQVTAQWSSSTKIKGNVDGRLYIIYNITNENTPSVQELLTTMFFGNLTADSTLSNITFAFGKGVKGLSSTKVFDVAPKLSDVLIVSYNSVGTLFSNAIYTAKDGKTKGFIGGNNWEKDFSFNGQGFDSLEERIGRVVPREN